MANLVDITHTVKQSESKGRALFFDLSTGKRQWEERRAIPRDENTVWPLPPETEEVVTEDLPEPAPKKGKK